MSIGGRSGDEGPWGARRTLLPAPTLPLAYFAGAHAALALAFGVLVFRPDIPGTFHYHPRAIALVHLVTLGWISGSILGALYIVGPLALGVPLRPGPADRLACGAFWAGTLGVVWGFWTGRYDVLSAASTLALVSVAFVGVRIAAGLATARLPFGISLHIVLAFVNVIGAGGLGAIMALSRLEGMLPWPPMSLAIAHGHIAVLGWAIMMIFGVGYRLIPMFVPAAMPKGPGLAVSAVLLEIGTLGLATSLVSGDSAVLWVVLVVASLASFFHQIRRTVRHRRPRPVELPRRDWSTWQAHAALLYLLVAAGLGIWLLAGDVTPARAWAYGVAGLVGFVAQMVVGIQGRLLPLQAWYRAMDRRDGLPPPVSVHRLVEPRLALANFLLWLIGVPFLIAGLAGEWEALVAVGAAPLLAAAIVNAVYGVRMVKRSS